MKKFCLLALFSVIRLSAQGPTQAIRLQLNLTDASPRIDSARFPYTIQEIINLEPQFQMTEASTGDPVSGMLASPAIGAWTYFYNANYPNEFAIKMVALLMRDGQSVGTRVSHIRFTDDPHTGASTGTCKVETFDLNGTLLMSATGTVSGGLVSISPFDDYPDGK